jgi:hypothetical protein
MPVDAHNEGQEGLQTNGRLMDLDPDPHWDLGLDTEIENMLDPDQH